MASSSRLIVAAHVLTVLAQDNQPVPSEFIAGSVNTNPVVIRRIVGLLAKAGLVSSTEGSGGGATLARSAERITLADVYAAVEDVGELFGSPRNDPNPDCPVGRHVQSLLKTRLNAAQSTMARELKKTTIADLLAGVRAAERC